VKRLADRGFADIKLFEMLERWGADCEIRIRGNVVLENKSGEARRADEWVPKNGRSLILRDISLTKTRAPVPAVVCVHAAKMKDSWCLATSRTELKSAEVVQLCGRRFTIEESFRDIKDPRFGLGFNDARVSTPARRDRLLFVATLAIALLTVLGAAGESLGMEKSLKAKHKQEALVFVTAPRTHAGINNGLLEGFNSLVQAAKARSRGFRSPKKMATIIYLLLAKLDSSFPRRSPPPSMRDSEEPKNAWPFLTSTRFAPRHASDLSKSRRIRRAPKAALCGVISPLARRWRSTSCGVSRACLSRRPGRPQP
jgi:hypothetical protein